MKLQCCLMCQEIYIKTTYTCMRRKFHIQGTQKYEDIKLWKYKKYDDLKYMTILEI